MEGEGGNAGPGNYRDNIEGGPLRGQADASF